MTILYAYVFSRELVVWGRDLEDAREQLDNSFVDHPEDIVDVNNWEGKRAENIDSVIIEE